MDLKTSVLERSNGKSFWSTLTRFLCSLQENQWAFLSTSAVTRKECIMCHLSTLTPSLWKKPYQILSGRYFCLMAASVNLWLKPVLLHLHAPFTTENTYCWPSLHTVASTLAVDGLVYTFLTKISPWLQLMNFAQTFRAPRGCIFKTAKILLIFLRLTCLDNYCTGFHLIMYRHFSSLWMNCNNLGDLLIQVEQIVYRYYPVNLINDIITIFEIHVNRQLFF